MIHLSTHHVVSWPTPAGPAVDPVSPVASVAPARDAPSGFGAGRDGQGAPARAPATRVTTSESEGAAEAAPLLPRRHGPGGAEGRSGSAPDAVPGSTASAAQQKKAEKAEKAEQAAKAQAEAAAEPASPPLQVVLATVWEASAAVVERALGRLSGADDKVPGIQSDTAPDLSAVAAAQMNRRPLLPAAAQPEAPKPLPWPVMPAPDEAPSGLASPDEGATTDHLVGYDENGHGSRAPVEAGSLFSERV